MRDLELQLAADAISGSSGDRVSTWTDSSSNSRHATQSSAALQPILRTNALNGHNVIEFGTSSYTFLTLPSTNNIFVSGTGLTMYAVLMSEEPISGGLSFVVDYGLYSTLGLGFAWDDTQIKYLYTPTTSTILTTTSSIL